MGKGLFEYAAENPEKIAAEGERAGVERRATAKAVTDQEKAEELRKIVAAQIADGEEPEIILYSAVKVIGLLTNDPKWTEQQRQALDLLYIDAGQLSLTSEAAQRARERREQYRREYVKKEKKRLEGQIKACDGIKKNLTDAYNIIAAIMELDDL